MTTSPIKFGTDGWRAVIAEEYTFANVRVCAQAVAEYLKESGLGARGLIVGYDTRFASEDFAAAVAEVVAANGVKAYLCTRAAPTPVISYGTLAHKAGGAVIITASHNQGRYNGFKIKSPTGSSAPETTTAAVEKNVARILAEGGVKRVPLTKGLEDGTIERLDLTPVYFEQIRKLVDINSLKQARLKITVDPMHGAGAGYLKEILAGGTLELAEIDGDRNPVFPGMERPEPIAPNLLRLSAAVRRRRAAVGLATDGDADRFGVIDENGRFLTTLEVMALLALYLLDVRGQRGAIIRTITSSAMLDRLGELYNVPVYQTPVGFKYVAPLMESENAIIGGEESGGYGFRGHVLERDGILASLYFLDFMVRTGKTPAQLLEYLFSKVGRHYFDRVDIEFPAAERETIIGRMKNANPSTVAGVKVERIDTRDGFHFILADRSWLLVRFSGTEPLLRTYAEAGSPERVAEMLKAGRAMAGV